MATTTPQRDLPSEYLPPPPGGRRRSRLLIGILLAAAVIAAAVAAVLLARDDGEEAAPPTTAPSSTAPAPTTPTTVPSAGTTTAVWPFSSTANRFTDPVAAATSFAVDYLGFVDPVVGDFRQGDTRSGEIEVRPLADAPATTVFVRQLGPGDSWWVLGAATADIQLQEPAALAEVSPPVRLRGVSTAFEALVQVEIREDGAMEPLTKGYVMGGSMGEMGPFDGTFAFDRSPAADAGAVVMFTRSMADGRVWEASVVRVRFAPGQGTVSACPDYRSPRPEVAAGQMLTTIFLTCGEAVDTPVPVYRVVPSSPGVLRAALEELLAGPSDAERSAGLASWFSADTAGMLAGVTIGSDGAAVVDFEDLRPVIPNASASAGSKLLLAQLDATVFQFPTVQSVVYRINGDCEAFSEWLQFGGCDPRLRP